MTLLEVVNEGSSPEFDVEFRDSDGALATPSTASYWTEDVGSDRTLRAPTAVGSLSSTVTVRLSFIDTQIVHPSKQFEERVLKVAAEYATGTLVTEVPFLVRNMGYVVRPADVTAIAPEDLAAAQLVLEDDSADLWQDVAATTPAQFGDPVGKWDSKVGSLAFTNGAELHIERSYSGVWTDFDDGTGFAGDVVDTSAWTEYALYAVGVVGVTGLNLLGGNYIVGGQVGWWVTPSASTAKWVGGVAALAYGGPADSLVLMRWRLAASGALTFDVSGAAQQTYAGASVPGSVGELFAQRGGPVTGTDARLKALALFDSSLSDADDAAVQAYYRAKYGVTL